MGGMGGGNMGGGGGMGMGQWNGGAAPGGPPQDVMAGTGFTYGSGGGGNPGAAADFEQQTTQVTIPKDVAGAIIGRGGERIRNIRMKSGANIKMDEAKEGSNERVITLTGNNNQIQYAQFLMQQSVRQYSQPGQGAAGR